MLKYSELNLDFSNLFLLKSEGAARMRVYQFEKYKSGRMSSEDASRFEGRLEEWLRAGMVEAIEPGLIRKAQNLSREVAKDISAGRPRVVQSVIDKRMEECRSCELYNKKKGTCKHPRCGCVMRRKTRWAGSECPIGRWGEILDPMLIEGGEK